jgi:hypothetical protein
MHHSDDPDRTALAVTCYMDDSATHEGSVVAVIGGVLMNRPNFINCASVWADILHRYRITPPLKMSSFVRPGGRNIGMPHELKLALFQEVADAINNHKIYSISVAVPQVDFKELIAMDVYRKLMAPYALCFIAAAGINERLATFLGYPGKISYLIDEGSSYQDQLLTAHTTVIESERIAGRIPHTGSIAFASDDDNATLQAADVIAWSSRRKAEYGSLDNEFAPLQEILAMKLGRHEETQMHVNFEVPKEGMRGFSVAITDWLESHGKFPDLGLAGMLKLP